MKINKQDFSFWKNDLVTKEFFLSLERLRSEIEEQMLSDKIIASAEGHLRLNRLAGMREGIDHVLYISIEDFDYDEEDCEASGVSSISQTQEI